MNRLFSGATAFVMTQVLVAVPGIAQDFQGLGHLPGGVFVSEAYDISADGLVVVGKSFGESGYEAYRWTAETGMIGLGDLPKGLFFSIAYGVSADGSVIVGAGRPPGGLVYEAFRWTEADGMVGLGFLPGSSFDSFAYSVSSDGSVVVGRSSSSDLGQPVAFRWKADEGMIALGVLPNGVPTFQAWGVSDDGTVVTGVAQSVQAPTIPPEAFRWTEGGGVEALGFLPGGIGSYLSFLNDDGTLAYGSGSSAEGYQALRWTVAEGLVGLGVSQWDAHILDASADSSVFVGTGLSDTGALTWDPAKNGPRLLQDVLVNDYGLDLTGWWLRDAYGVSADGTTIVGRGTNPDGNPEGWIVHLPLCAIPGDPGCDGDVNDDCVIDPLDSGFILSRFGCDVAGGDPGCVAADANVDGLVDPLDVGFVLARFGECP